jgi:hypothetical protein
MFVCVGDTITLGHSGGTKKSKFGSWSVAVSNARYPVLAAVTTASKRLRQIINGFSLSFLVTVDLSCR